jgi:hypothetical protein
VEALEAIQSDCCKQTHKDVAKAVLIATEKYHVVRDSELISENNVLIVDSFYSMVNNMPETADKPRGYLFV